MSDKLWRIQLLLASRFLASVFGLIAPFFILAFVASCHRCEGWGVFLACNTAVYLGAVVAMMVLHELGHMAVGAALGLRIFSVQFGTGSPIFSREIRGVQVSVGTTMLGAFTLITPVSSKWLRSKLWLTYAAGPMVHVVALILFAHLDVGSDWHNLRAFSHAVLPMKLFLFANGVLLLVNLLPMRSILGGVCAMTDGARMLWVPFASRRSLDRMLEVANQLKAHRFLKVGRLEEALQLLPKLEAIDLEDVPGQLSRACVLLELGRAGEARERLLSLRAFPKLGPRLEAFLDNALAWSAIVLDDPTLLPDAELRSVAALAALPDMPAFRNTRGSVLVRQQRVEEGLPFLHSAWRWAREPSAKAQIACMVAEAEARLGRTLEAEGWVQKARALSPTCPLLAMAQRCVGGMELKG